MGTRKTPRFETRGKVYIAEVLDTDAIVKNLSASGLCLESPEFMNVVPNAKYTVDLVPEKESEMDPFKIDIESRWVRTTQAKSESGFVIVVPPGTPGESLLKQYLEFLEQHAKQAE
jgi:hypothetical protein